MKNRHSVEQIIRILGEIERAGLKISDACRPHGISEQTYYRWRNKYGGMEISEARRLRELETENGYIEPGAPWENAYVESSHAQVRLELLDRELFFNLREVNA